MIDIAPPVPASLRIARDQGTRPRIEDDEMVGVRPGVIPGVFNKPLADVVNILLASRERDMNAAPIPARAIVGDIDITRIGKA